VAPALILLALGPSWLEQIQDKTNRNDKTW
jgi:hypothetical protein